MSKRPAILITGAARRVGAALALYFARYGYDIALHYNSSKADATKLKIKIEKLGAQCTLFHQDLSDIEALPRFMQDVRTYVRNCTALINNASIFERAEFMDTDEALFDRQFAVNFKAPFFLTQAFATTFGKGCVIHMLDTYIQQNEGSHFAYLLSKKTLAEFTTMAARALGPEIRVNGICPTIMLPSEYYDEAYMKNKAQLLPLKRLPVAEEVAAAAYWLCESKAITGQLLFPDGGHHLL